MNPNEENRVQVLKEPSTPDDPSQAILNGLQRIDESFSSLVHGSTVATNAMLERKGARVVMLTTEGFRDVIEIGRQDRGSIYDLNVDRPEPPVPRNLRFELPERIDHLGNVITPLEIGDDLIKQIRRATPEAIAVCLLFSYINPEHEQETRRHLREAGIECYWSLSSEVSPQYREYERFSTTAINAFVTPVMERYLGNLEDQIQVPHIRIMQSNGGSMAISAARNQAVQTLLSGPVGGVVAAHSLAKSLQMNNVISFDMGGTSTDVSYIPGRIDTTDDAKIDGLPVNVPMVNIHTVGSGGGSVAYRDSAGVLQVGPRSAGARPGPICYDQGGEEFTVTDVNLLAGRLVPDAQFGNRIQLNQAKSRRFGKEFADAIGSPVSELLLSILAIANAKMERALRVISVERGYDPGEAALIAFGGAGPLHACALAEAMRIPEIVIPVQAGVFSALGLLQADVVRDRTQTLLQRTPDINWARIRDRLADMQKAIENDIVSQGIDPARITSHWSLAMRYRGQSYELEIPWQEEMPDAFHQRHFERYRFRHDDRQVEVVNLRVRGVGDVDAPGLPEDNVNRVRVDPESYPEITGITEDGELSYPIIPREDLSSGTCGEGPVLIPESTSTAFIAPGWQFSIDKLRNIRITREEYH